MSKSANKICVAATGVPFANDIRCHDFGKNCGIKRYRRPLVLTLPPRCEYNWKDKVYKLAEDFTVSSEDTERESNSKLHITFQCHYQLILRHLLETEMPLGVEAPMINGRFNPELIIMYIHLCSQFPMSLISVLVCRNVLK